MHAVNEIIVETFVVTKKKQYNNYIKSEYIYKVNKVVTATALHHSFAMFRAPSTGALQIYGGNQVDWVFVAETDVPEFSLDPIGQSVADSDWSSQC